MNPSSPLMHSSNDSSTDEQALHCHPALGLQRQPPASRPLQAGVQPQWQEAPMRVRVVEVPQVREQKGRSGVREKPSSATLPRDCNAARVAATENKKKQSKESPDKTKGTAAKSPHVAPALAVDLPLFNGPIKIFTVGHVSSNASSIGIYVEDNHPLNLSQKLSNNRDQCGVEITAAQTALNMILATNGHSGMEKATNLLVTIRTNSMEIIDYMNSNIGYNSGRELSHFEELRQLGRTAQRFGNGVSFERAYGYNPETHRYQIVRAHTGGHFEFTVENEKLAIEKAVILAQKAVRYRSAIPSLKGCEWPPWMNWDGPWSGEEKASNDRSRSQSRAPKTRPDTQSESDTEDESAIDTTSAPRSDVSVRSLTSVEDASSLAGSDLSRRLAEGIRREKSISREIQEWKYWTTGRKGGRN